MIIRFSIWIVAERLMTQNDYYFGLTWSRPLGFGQQNQHTDTHKPSKEREINSDSVQWCASGVRSETREQSHSKWRQIQKIVNKFLGGPNKHEIGSNLIINFRFRSICAILVVKRALWYRLKARKNFRLQRESNRAPKSNCSNQRRVLGVFLCIVCTCKQYNTTRAAKQHRLLLLLWIVWV